MSEPLAPVRVAVTAAVACVLIALSGLVIGVDLAVLALAAFAAAGAVARVVTPMGRAFAVRRRAIDVAVLAFLAIGLAFLGFTTPLA
ncbi:DUF3017 domain-containing protein [Demequina sp. SYSU T00039]|uniref:DUF3017 domain-containing protein n=1 Tax=Demequina lignilytica TaxID=3051663 RepID=A0AAW7M1B1_9MICO|nr:MULTISPECIES: DUF3017 domain-containing protein [unclassified Demequina]MDN4478197.1 DUF3017 domain-containing protein [Demequina sp. SYSU T00039-1]MDN4488353.1 DUF3017 domain-containing protein [Demequina sp. SYSU T00039]MDN4490100.1 DUF3017 domain-containing protein [Demequina sp. SYSU T00068]